MKEILLKDKIKEFEYMLTDVTYLINNVKTLKEDDILIPLLLLARSETFKFINYITGVKEDLIEDRTIYKYFNSLKEVNKERYELIESYIIKELNDLKLNNKTFDKKSFNSLLLDEIEAIDAAIYKMIEKKYLLFYTSFLITVLKGVMVHSLTDYNLEENYETSEFAYERTRQINAMLIPFIHVYNRYKDKL